MPMSAHEVRHALGELEDLRYAAGNLDQALRRIVDATHQLFAVDGAGLMLVDPDQRCATSPCPTGASTTWRSCRSSTARAPVSTPSRTRPWSTPRTWPPRPVGPSSARRRSSGACGRCWPARFPTTSMPSGWWWCSQPRCTPGPPEGELALVAFTDLAALTIANTLQGEERGQLASQLQRALDARVVIEQAKGALVAREGLSEREAFERLRRQARRQRRRVVEVAAEMMAAV